MPTVQKISRYGWRRDRPDPRDYVFALAAPPVLPPTSDLTAEMPPIYDQGQLGSCTAQGAAAVMQNAQMRQGEAEGKIIPSRLFIYYEERRIGGYPLNQDTGAEVRDGIKVLASEGAPPETDWPYSDANPGPFQKKPPASAYADALHYEAVQYQKIVVGKGTAIRTALVNHMPVVFGFPVPARFEDPSWNPATQPLGLPGRNTQWIGGHATVIVGHDYSRTRFPKNDVFKIRNSWGASWGDRGHFYMDVRWFEPKRNLASDLWVISKTS